LDYNPINVNFDLNSSPATGNDALPFTVTILDDGNPEPAKIFDLVIGVATVACPAAPPVVISPLPITIIDDDPPPGGGGDINLAGQVGEVVSSLFFATGTAPLSLSAQSGSVTPASLAVPGNATYSFTIPADATPGTTLSDVITITDNAGTVSMQQLRIAVVATNRDLSGISNLTPNQQSLATWFDSTCPRLDPTGGDPGVVDLTNVCAGLRDDRTTDAQVVTALDAINPEELIVFASTAVRLMAVQHGNMSQRINALRAGASGLDLAGLNVEGPNGPIPSEAFAELIEQGLGRLFGAAASADQFSRWGLFVNGNVKFGEKDQTADEQAFDFDMLALTMGVDYRFKPNLIVGASIGYASVEADFDSGSETDIDNWNGTLFGTYYVDDKFYIDGLLSYGSSDYDSKRRIVYTDINGTIDRTAKGDTDGTQLSAGLSAGFDFNRGPWTLGPHLGSYYIDVEVDEFVETGAMGLNMNISDQDAKSFTVNAGFHASYVVNTSWGVLIPHLRLDAVHEFEDNREFVAVGFVNDPFADDPLQPSPPIVLQTDEIDSDWFVMSAGVSAQFIHGVSGFINYQRTSSFDEWTINDVNYGLRFERTF
jgi:outer membrane autotransporter protein